MKLSLAAKQWRIKVDDSEVPDINNDPGIKIKSSPNISPADIDLNESEVPELKTDPEINIEYSPTASTANINVAVCCCS